MSGNRSLHRESIQLGTVWSVAATPTKSSSYRVWAAGSDGVVRGLVVDEKEASADMLDASALAIQCTHHLVGAETALTRVGVVRNYVGDDTDVGDLLVAGMDLGGTVRIWVMTEESMDGESGGELVVVQPAVEFAVPGATGTTLALSPTWSVGDVTVAVGCLDGTIAIVATGLLTPKATRDPTPSGTVLDTRGSSTSACPLALAWHPRQPQVLVVGRQDGTIDILNGTRKGQHRIHIFQSPIRALSFMPDASMLMAGSDQGLLAVWDVQRSTPTLVHHIMDAHKGWILSMHPLSDSRRFVTAGSDNRICLWDLQQMHQASHTFQCDSTMYAVYMCGGSSTNVPLRLVASGKEGMLHIFSLEA